MSSPKFYQVGGQSYFHKTDHRNGSPRKSQWTISEINEREVFKVTVLKNWIDKDGWGLNLDKDNVDYLGIGRIRQHRLFIARFLNYKNGNTWHGFPADHMENRQDVPSNTILNEWQNSNILAPSKIRKIMRGQSCNL